METEKAIEILKNYLSETYSKFCKVGTVGIPNEEYFAIETVLKELEKKDKIIYLMAKTMGTDDLDYIRLCDYCKYDKSKEPCNAKGCVENRINYFSKLVEEAE